MDGFSKIHKKKHKNGEEHIDLKIPEGHLWLDFTTIMGITSVSFSNSLNLSPKLWG